MTLFNALAAEPAVTPASARADAPETRSSSVTVSRGDDGARRPDASSGKFKAAASAEEPAPEDAPKEKIDATVEAVNMLDAQRRNEYAVYTYEIDYAGTSSVREGEKLWCLF